MRGIMVRGILWQPYTKSAKACTCDTIPYIKMFNVIIAGCFGHFNKYSAALDFTMPVNLVK